jgi:hypothetical protein
MNSEELRMRYEELQQKSKEFQEGFRSGEKHAREQIKQNKILYNLFLEAIGYKDEWLINEKGLDRLSKKDLIDIILKQRALMRSIYNADSSEKESLKIKIEKYFWPVMHQDKM